MVTSLVDIISLCYTQFNSRTPKQVLRLYNQCFVFAVLSKSTIGTPCKITARRFYGCHFHSLTSHIPEVARVFCLRSIVVENEERTFGDMRRISEATSNRHPESLVDNAVIRFNAQQQSDLTEDSFTKQDSAIVQQARLLPATTNTVIPKEWLQKRASVVQAHLERIADFILPGENVWWRVQPNSGDLEFMDSPVAPPRAKASEL